MIKLLAVAAAIALVSGGSAKAGTLDTIKARGTVLCGVSTGVAGFSLADSQGEWTGIDTEICRALAAAVRRRIPVAEWLVRSSRIKLGNDRHGRSAA